MALLKELSNLLKTKATDSAVNVTDVGTNTTTKKASPDLVENSTPAVKPGVRQTTDVGTNTVSQNSPYSTGNPNYAVTNAVPKATAGAVPATDVAGTKTVSTLGNNTVSTAPAAKNIDSDTVAAIAAAVVEQMEGGSKIATTTQQRLDQQASAEKNKAVDGTTSGSNPSEGANTQQGTSQPSTGGDSTNANASDAQAKVESALTSSRTAIDEALAALEAANSISIPTSKAYGEYVAPEQQAINAPTYEKLVQDELSKPGEYTAPAQEELSRPTFSDPGGYSGSMPTFSGTYTEQIKQVLQEVLDRKGLEYDQSRDPFYATNKELYTNAGKQAMRDSMGQAATLTGGYASSYAQAVGQQQYNNYMQQLASMAPDLYQMAADKYERDSENLNNRFNALQSVDNTEYSRHRDDVSDYWSNVSQSNWERSFAQSQYGMELSQYNADRSQQNYENEFAYNQYRDTVSDYQWDANYQNSTEQQNYQKYLDQLNQYNIDVDRQTAAENEQYNRYVADRAYNNTISEQERDQANIDKGYAIDSAQSQLNQVNTDRSFNYGVARDEVSDNYNNKVLENTLSEQQRDQANKDRAFAYQEAQDKLAQSNYEKSEAFDEWYKAYSIYNSSAGSGSKTSSNSDVLGTELYKNMKSYVQKNGWDEHAISAIANWLNSGVITETQAKQIGDALGHGNLYPASAEKASTNYITSNDAVSKIFKAENSASSSGVSFDILSTIKQMYQSGQISKDTVKDLLYRYGDKYNAYYAEKYKSADYKISSSYDWVIGNMN